jgi:alpha-galactosidase
MRTLRNIVAIGLVAILALGAALAVTPAAWAGDQPSTGPVMGWNPWYEYRTGVTEDAVLQQANLLVSSGLVAAGYNYVNLDDGWMAAKRTASGSLTGNSGKFPHGIPWLVTQVHSLGLKFGIYEAIGSRTCQNYPGSYGHYAQDAKTFAQWGVDFVKVDNCGGLPAKVSATALTADFKSFGQALRAANPAVTYSEELPVAYVGQSAFAGTVRASAGFADMWRVTKDESPASSAPATILGHLAADLHLHAFAGPGHWNDLDMLVAGVPAFGWTLAQEQGQLSVWAQEASPLLLSANIATLAGAKLAALKNPQLIAIDQSGAQAAEAITSGHVEAVVKPYPGGGRAVLLANLGGGASTSGFTLRQLGLSGSRASSHNVWTGATCGLASVSVTLAKGQTELLVLRAA